jgi:hypothetical protein
MAISVKELIAWLQTLDETDLVGLVGVDDGGLTLQSADDPDAYCEVGGAADTED